MPYPSAGREPRPQLPRGPRLLIGVLHVALCAALVVFIFRFVRIMDQMDIALAKVIYVPIGAAVLAVFVAVRGLGWLLRRDGSGGGDAS